MKIDYHMHFEYGAYDEAWVEGFFRAAAERGLDEIGITEHTHTFPEFEPLYYEDLVLDDSFIGIFQKKWLKKNKFKYTLDAYFAFMRKLQKNHAVKIGIEVCNFQDSSKVRDILKDYAFDYVIGSVHFLRGWAYDSSEIKAEWERHSLAEVYEWYTEEAEKLCASGLYDVLGHPFNIRLFGFLPEFDVSPYLERVAKAMAKAHMAVDVNTGTLYRYPIQEISPYPDFMRMAVKYDLPVITSSDAHKPEDCGRHIDDALLYLKGFGYGEILQFEQRKAVAVPLG